MPRQSSRFRVPLRIHLRTLLIGVAVVGLIAAWQAKSERLSYGRVHSLVAYHELAERNRRSQIVRANELLDEFRPAYAEVVKKLNDGQLDERHQKIYRSLEESRRENIEELERKITEAASEADFHANERSRLIEQTRLHLSDLIPFWENGKEAR